MQKTRQKLVCRKNLRTPSPSKHPRLLLFLPESRRFQHFHQSFAVTFLTGLTLFTRGKQNLSFPGVHFTPASVFFPPHLPFPQLPVQEPSPEPGLEELPGSAHGHRAGLGMAAGVRAGPRAALPQPLRSLRSCSPRSAPARQGGEGAGRKR